ncbi:hypothetical protein M0R89_04405 [Halorussus limi]|uniref:DNA mismatch repair MutH/Type II restriction enzyme Sau3AI domain-containing protein n=1 Tax=Halorussus limi TaxID=2938695 RepID=A0A8U0HX57_9EURY|nr:MutH/Sau3AI family endonuclease [Halorussus limi]UPV75311.1 hypothetical protein M0R89_04405 [Halorussus limi]
MTGLTNGVTASREEILQATNRLLGKTFGDIDAEINGMADDERARSKHGVANVIEEGYFDIAINNDARPDFTDEGIELKVTPLRRTGGNELLRPKERLVLCMCDYTEIAEADHWTEVPALQKKLSSVLIIWYIHIVGQDRATYPIVWWDLWEPMDDPRWREQLQEDFEICKEKVMNGETPSEKHTTLLGTCPKHSGGYDHEDPASSPRHARVSSDAHPILDYAEKRGWSIGMGGAMEIFQEATGLQKASRGRASGIEIEELWGEAQKKAPHDVRRFSESFPEL